MKLSLALSVATALFVSKSIAAPADPLHGFPQLLGLTGKDGMASVDLDGIYRAYLADGTIVDAARLTPVHIEMWLNARVPHLSAEEAAAERAHYSKIDLKAVRDAHLLVPAEDVKPLAMLAKFQISRREASPLEERSGVNGCASSDCVNTPYVCFGACHCNTFSCVH